MVEVHGSINRPPMPESASAALLPLARRVDPEVDGVAVGGGSDGNFTAALGVPTLDGLGAVGGGAHADHEYVDVGAIPGRVRLLAGLLSELVAAPLR
jgi:glutamate carboxypeptidase